MAKYQGKNQCRKPHPKIFVWSHTEKAEIEYFLGFKNHLGTHQLMPGKMVTRQPQQLIEKIIDWKKEQNLNNQDNDQVWCIFDIDDFYENNKTNFLNLIDKATKNNIRIAYSNECFEHWVLMHFEKPGISVKRGSEIITKINKHFQHHKLGTFEKNDNIFKLLLPYQEQAIQNAKQLLRTDYKNIKWNEVLSKKGNPSTSIHLLVEDIKQLIQPRQ